MCYKARMALTVTHGEDSACVWSQSFRDVSRLQGAQQGVRLLLEKLAAVRKHLIEKYYGASTVA